MLKYCPNTLKVIKSTVLPSLLKMLHQIDSNIVYNPEFLREKHAKFDFINSEMIVLGGNESNTKKVANIYKRHSLCTTKNYIFTDLETASFIKYSINTFLATKVIFFNQLFNIFENLNVNDEWIDVISFISKDKRIGSSHMDVPGHDGRFGFGGACFPKDTLAFAKYAKSIDVDFSLLVEAIKSNKTIRSKYESLDSREQEQNISFSDKI